MAVKQVKLPETTIHGVDVKATLRTAFIYKEITGGDFLLEIQKISTAYDPETGLLDLDTEMVFGLFYAMKLTADRKPYKKKEYEDFTDSFSLQEIESIAMEVIDFVFLSVATTEEQPKDEDKKGKKGKN